jgi:hypothetical protein
MDSYTMEIAAAERQRQALEAAETHRLLRSIAADPAAGQSWRGRLAVALSRRRARAAEAS